MLQGSACKVLCAVRRASLPTEPGKQGGYESHGGLEQQRTYVERFDFMMRGKRG